MGSRGAKRAFQSWRRASLDFAAKKKRTKRDVFLAEMDAYVDMIVPRGGRALIEAVFPVHVDLLQQAIEPMRDLVEAMRAKLLISELQARRAAQGGLPRPGYQIGRAHV